MPQDAILIVMRFMEPLKGNQVYVFNPLYRELVSASTLAYPECRALGHYQCYQNKIATLAARVF